MSTGQEPVLDRLASRLDGDLCLPGSDGYRGATTPWNSAARQRPAAVAIVTGSADVVACVQAARDSGLRVAVQATGHGAAGVMGPETLLVDTSRLNSVAIDAERRTARVGAGAAWAVVNAAAERHGLLGLSGSAATVAVAGYTFVGGVGWLVRAHGMASARLRAAEFVDGLGHSRRADQDAADARDLDALWACRGGGGVGLATDVEFDLVPAGDLWAGYVLWPAAHTEQVVDAWARLLRTAGPELTTAIAVLRLPDAPEIPEALRGRPAVRLIAASVAGVDGAAALTSVIGELPPPSANTLGRCDAARLATIHFDPPGPVPALGDGRWLNDDAAAAAFDVITACGTGPGFPLTMIELRHVAAADRGVPGAMTSPPGPLLLHADGDASTPNARRQTEQAIAEVRRAAAPTDTGHGAVAFMASHTTAPDALDADSKSRLRRIHAVEDPAQLFHRPRVLA